MPTYQYRCTACGHELEEFQSFTDDALTVCPVCGGQLRKVFNAVGVVFKGSGFYRTDSRTDSRTASAATDGGSSSSTTETKTDTKTEKKAESKPAAAASTSASSSSSD